MKSAGLVLLLLAIFVGSASATRMSSAQASWYGPGFYGNHTACGQVLTTGTWGVAHKSLPCGTRLMICYTKCVATTVIDRGPYVYGRDFDLTYPVKVAIGMQGGVGTIRYRIMS